MARKKKVQVSAERVKIVFTELSEKNGKEGMMNIDRARKLEKKGKIRIVTKE